jgi:hypothetical protein
MEVAHRIWDRLHAVPPLVYDGLWAVLLCVVAAAELHFYRTGVATASPSLRSMAVVLLFTLPLAVRRRHPTICFGSQVAGSFLIPAQPPFTAIFALLLGTYSFCVYGPAPWLALVWILIGSALLQAFLPTVRMPVPPRYRCCWAGW